MAALFSLAARFLGTLLVLGAVGFAQVTPAATPNGPSSSFNTLSSSSRVLSTIIGYVFDVFERLDELVDYLSMHLSSSPVSACGNDLRIA